MILRDRINLLFASGRGIVTDYLEDTKRERAEDAERRSQFSRQCPRLCSVPFFGIICRWLYIQTWIYCGLLLIIVLVGFVLRLKGLGAMEFIEDEYQVIGVAYGYLQSGTFYKWNFLTKILTQNYYDRAWPHSLMIAVSFKWLGFSEWSARLPSLIFGTLLIPLSYFIGKHATDRKVIGLQLAVIVAFSSSMIFLSQYARMYVVFIPVFLTGSYLLFRGLEGRCTWRFERFPPLKWIVHNFDFDYRYLIAAGIVLAFSYLLHINTLIIGLGVFVFIIIMAIRSRETRYISLAGLFLLILTVIIIGYMAGAGQLLNIFSWIDILGPHKLHYFVFLFKYPFGMYISALLIAVIGIFALKNHELLYYLCLTLTALVYFAFFSNRYFSSTYISNYSVYAWLLLLPSAALTSYCLFRKKKKVWQIGFSVIVLLAVFASLVASSGVLWYEYKPTGPYGHFKEGYADLNEKYRAGDLLMGQYLRKVYITIPGKVNYVSLENYQQFTYEEFLDTMAQYDRIWITWETRKSFHIQPEIIQFVDSNFKKIHGKGIDDTNVELYFWDKTSDEESDLSFNYFNGWHALENWNGVRSRWMSNNATLLVFSPDTRNATLELNSVSFFRVRTLEIFSNNVNVKTEVVPAWSFVQITANLTLNPGENEIRFFVPEGCERPVDIPGSTNLDGRCLSLGMQKLGIITERS